MLTATSPVTCAGLDAIALKPAECDVSNAASVPVETIVIDYEGRAHLPEEEALESLSESADVFLTTPVRADGFDPLGDETLLGKLPEGVGRILVAGHAAYLTDEEQTRAVSPRLGAALESDPDAWVGTEGVERIAMATGATQFELYSRTTERELRSLRNAGFDDEISVYAPTVFADNEDEILDAIGSYVARRRPVSKALPEEARTDASAQGRSREILLEAARDYALVGPEAVVQEQTESLREAGATTVVGYPASGLEAFLE
ncbi:LLM class flavin-dependent oxidoreductase [Halostagnicola bangensis]